MYSKFGTYNLGLKNRTRTAHQYNLKEVKH